MFAELFLNFLLLFQQYLDAAEQDKERYTREYNDYKQTEAYRIFSEKLSSEKQNDIKKERNGAEGTLENNVSWKGKFSKLKTELLLVKIVLVGYFIEFRSVLNITKTSIENWKSLAIKLINRLIFLGCTTRKRGRFCRIWHSNFHRRIFRTQQRFVDILQNTLQENLYSFVILISFESSIKDIVNVLTL